MKVVPIPNDALPIPPLPNTQALSSPTFTRPPLDGSLMVPEIYDWHYVNSPEHPVFVYPGADGENKTISWATYVRGVHTAAKIVVSHVKRPADEKKPCIVGILASSDAISSFAIIIGVMRAGYTPFLLSPRNSAAATAHLLADTQAEHILLGRDQPLQDLAAEALQILQGDPKYSDLPKLPTTSLVPLFEDIYRPVDEASELLPPAKPDPRSVAVIVHSSGSTAFPKPIPWTHYGFLLYALVPYFGDLDFTGMRMSTHAIPMFHTMGVMLTGWVATTGLTITAAQPRSPTVPLTSDNVIDGAFETKAEYIFTTPFFPEVWAKDPRRVEQLKTEVKGIIFGGGPLNKHAGETFTQEGIRLVNLYGSSETGIISRIIPKSVCPDPEYFEISKQFKPVFEPNGAGQFELVLLPNPFERPYVINGKIGEEDAYFTSDLLEPHPNMTGYWKVFGRSDDQIMHNTGEKTNPGPLESIMNQDPRVKASVMFGRGRFNTGILIEPAEPYTFDPEDTDGLVKFRNDIWPTVERMNKYAPQHSRLFKEMIMVTKPSKPFQYTSKNTLRRQAMINLYEPEISALYDAVEESSQLDIPPPEDWDHDSIAQFIRHVVTKVMEAEVIADEGDIFQAGADSLQATWIRNTLLRAMRDSAQVDTNLVPQNVVFENPTISALSSFASRFVEQARSGSLTAESVAVKDEDKIRSMLDMVSKYTTEFPTHPSTGGHTLAETGPSVVLVTGTTGGLGTRLLADLHASPDVVKIYAVNRKQHTSLEVKQKESLVKQGLDPGVVDSDKVVLVEADLSKENAGLAPEVLEEVLSSVTHIIHNAWRVDFNLSLSSFESNIRGVRRLIEVALSSKLPSPPRLLYTSSIAVVGANPSGQPAPEEPLPASRATLNGYSQSKWVSEEMLLKASEKTALRPVIVRIGQVSGGRPTGYWNETDWVPAMIKSSLTLGCFPSADTTIAWIPLDLASRAIMELRHSNTPVVHLVHPTPVPWSVLADTISSKFHVAIVPYSEWLNLVEERAKVSADRGGVDDSVPAAMILPFFRGGASSMAKPQDGAEGMGLARLSVSKAKENSPTLGNGTRVIGEEEILLWLDDWRKRGYMEW